MINGSKANVGNINICLCIRLLTTYITYFLVYKMVLLRCDRISLCMLFMIKLMQNTISYYQPTTSVPNRLLHFSSKLHKILSKSFSALCKNSLCANINGVSVANIIIRKFLYSHAFHDQIIWKQNCLQRADDSCSTYINEFLKFVSLLYEVIL